MKRVCILFSTLLLSACWVGNTGEPVISFIGISTGTLETNLKELAFRDRFETDEQNLVAVVGFQQVREGTTVQATWFSPDDRRMPLGRTSIVTQSGAKIARFSFGSNKLWEAAPYLVQIDAFDADDPLAKHATGSLAFYIGMTESQIAAYQKEFAEWKKADDAERAVWEAQQASLDHLLATVQETLGFDEASILLQRDITGDAREDYVIQDAAANPGMGGGGPGVLLSATVRQVAVADGSGSVLLALRERRGARIVESASEVLIDDLPRTGDLQITILPSLTFSLTWTEDDQQCFAELKPSTQGYSLLQRGCR